MNLHQIYSPERDIYLRELKERVICGQPVADSEGYSDFVSEWQRSVEHNVDCRLPALGDEHRDFRVFENVSTFTNYIYEIQARPARRLRDKEGRRACRA